MENNYLSKIGQKDLQEFIEICISLGLEFDSIKFQNIVTNTLKYLNGDKEKRDELRYMQELENKWYKSLPDKPDYSVYNDNYYLADTWVCWKKYSRQYIKSILSSKAMENQSPKDYMGKINSIVDLGCGIGYTTATLKENFGCRVYGTNLKDTNQYKICKIISAKAGFELVSELNEIGKVDMVFASEYFEHFERPVEHLIEVIEKLKPKFIFFANTFNAKSIGHFNKYKHLEQVFNGLGISRLFTKELKARKYKKVKTNCFNNRPNFYEYGE